MYTHVCMCISSSDVCCRFGCKLGRSWFGPGLGEDGLTLISVIIVCIKRLGLDLTYSLLVFCARHK